MKMFYNNKIRKSKFFGIKLKGDVDEPMDKKFFYLIVMKIFELNF